MTDSILLRSLLLGLLCLPACGRPSLDGPAELAGGPTMSQMSFASGYESSGDPKIIDFGYNQTTGQTFVNAIPKGAEGAHEWLALFDGRTYGPPILSDKNTFIAVRAFGIARFDRKSGDMLSELELETDGNRQYGALGSDGTLYLTGLKLWAINPDDSIRYEAELPQRGWIAPALDDAGSLYVPTYVNDIGGEERSELVALSVSDGAQRWATELEGTPSAIALGEDTAYLSTAGPYRLYAFALGDGSQRWVHEGEVLGPVVAKDGTIYGGGVEGLLAIEPDTGATRWTSIGTGPCGSPSIGGNDHLYVACYDFQTEEGAEPHIIDEAGEVRFPGGSDSRTEIRHLTNNEPAPLLIDGQTWFVGATADGFSTQRYGWSNGPGLSNAPWPTRFGDAAGRSRRGSVKSSP